MARVLVALWLMTGLAALRQMHSADRGHVWDVLRKFVVVWTLGCAFLATGWTYPLWSDPAAFDMDPWGVGLATVLLWGRAVLVWLPPMLGVLILGLLVHGPAQHQAHVKRSR